MRIVLTVAGVSFSQGTIAHEATMPVLIEDVMSADRVNPSAGTIALTSGQLVVMGGVCLVGVAYLKVNYITSDQIGNYNCIIT